MPNKLKEIMILLVSTQPEKLLQKLKKPGYHVINISSASDGFSQMLNSSFDLVYLAYAEVKKEVIVLIERLANLHGITVVAV